MTEEQLRVVEECYALLAEVDLSGCIISIPIGSPKPPR